MSNIGIVTQLIYPHDREIRAKKIAAALNRGKHNVFIICQKGKHQNLNKKADYAIVHRFGYFSDFFALNHLLSIPLPINLFWVLWIFQVGKQEKLNLLIVRDLRLALPTIIVAKVLKLPVVLDYGENFPAHAKILGKHKLSDYIVRNKILISFLERVCAGFADYIWVVVEENRQRLINVGIDKNKIAVISNVPEISRSKTNNQLLSRKPSSCFRMIYVGLLDSFRDLSLILHSLRYILKKDDNIDMLIVGDGEERYKLESLTQTLKMESIVKFTGWVKPEHLPEFIKRSDVGLIPHKLNELTQTTIPNKFFDYMMAGLPVLATDMEPVRRIIEKEQCGLIIPNDPKEVANIIFRLKASPALLAEMGSNGKKAVFERYNWHIESNKILKTIDGLFIKKYETNYPKL